MNSTLPVVVVQQGLTVARARNSRVANPGIVDGLWGPRTQRSFESWLATTTFGQQAVEIIIDTTTPTRQDFLSVLDSVAAALQSLARGYLVETAAQDRPSAPRPASTPSAPAPTAARAAAILRPRPTLPWTAIGIGLATLGVVGVGFYLIKRKRRRRR